MGDAGRDAPAARHDAILNRTSTAMPMSALPRTLALTSLLLLGACSMLPKGPDTNRQRAQDAGVTNRMGHAAMTPLGDLNLVQTEIPAALKEATAGPYAVPGDLACQHLNDMIGALDDALGPDLDRPRNGKDSDLLDQGVDMAEDASVSAVRRTVEGFVPFRSWVRKLSGAERHSKRVSSAITAGTMRRAYLKGLRQGQGCAPAGPEPRPALTAAASAPVATPPGEPPNPMPSASAPAAADASASAQVRR